MVGVQVRDEDLLEIDEAHRRAQQLPLCSLAAVEEQAVSPAPDEMRRVPRRAVGALADVPRKTTSRSTRRS